jgi:NAD(P)-dependent dehydrogenase (short-subunit alcohol dehydrogenase family)
MSVPNTSSRVWLITGCSSGFGLALVSAVLARGHRVVATARQLSALGEFTARYPETCRAQELDVTDAAQVETVVTHAAGAFGRLDVVVNNAGYGIVGAFEELGKEQVRRNFETNFFGALEVIRASLPILRAQRSGHIVNISAAAVIANYAGFSIYGATKWALEGVSESLATELKPLGIKVTMVQPGPFRTDFIARSLERGENHIADYDLTSGKFLRLLESMAGKQPGDPGKAAEAIIAAVESDTPPLRLVLGKYANDKARKKMADAEKERVSWEQVGLPTDFNLTP